MKRLVIKQTGVYLAKTFFDSYWDQTKKRFGGFTSLNMKDEESLKSIIHSLLVTQVDTDKEQAGTSIDYEKLGLVVYCAVKSAITESIPDLSKLQLTAKPDYSDVKAISQRISRDIKDTPDNLPGVFFASDGDSNFDSAKSDVVDSSGVSDAISALRKMNS